MAGDLLDSLPAALDGLTADVVVVDNDSTDGTADLLAARAGCRVVRSANVGYAAGINRGVREAMRAEAILVLNPDVRLHPGSLPPLLAALREPDVGIAAPRVLSQEGTLEFSLRREPTLLRALGLTRTRLGIFSEYLSNPSDYSRPRTVDWALGAVILMSRQCYDTLGGWDETFFLYSEETDLALRAGRPACLPDTSRALSPCTLAGSRAGLTRRTPCRSSTGYGSTAAVMVPSLPGATTGWRRPISFRGCRAGTVSPGRPWWPCSRLPAVPVSSAARLSACPGERGPGRTAGRTPPPRPPQR